MEFPTNVQLKLARSERPREIEGAAKTTLGEQVSAIFDGLVPID
jgi:hypothetical protein